MINNTIPTFLLSDDLCGMVQCLMFMKIKTIMTATLEFMYITAVCISKIDPQHRNILLIKNLQFSHNFCL